MSVFGRALCIAAAAGTAAASISAQDESSRMQDESSRMMVLGAGDTIAITMAGAGPAVVMVPGLLGSAYGFRHVIASLVATGHRVIVVDPLGTGASSRPERADYTLEAQALRVLHAMDSTGVTSATLVCHSVGGSICYRLALRVPERVEGIVAINAGPDEHAATSGLRRALKFTPLIRLLGSGSMRGRLRDGLIDSSADPSWVTEEVVQAYTAPFGDLGRALRGLRGMAAAREPVALLPRLDDLSVPVVLLVGRGGNDDAMSAETLALLEQHVNRLTIRRVAGAGQYIQEEDPQAVVEAVRMLTVAQN
ncbi:MAG: alpha/beta fold hydrolase [Longimicrobiales bacterium]